MKKLYFATGNKQKLARMQFLANSFAEDFEILAVPNLVDVVEDGNTPLENAQIKVGVYKNLDAPVIAGDTGLYFDDIEFNPTHIKRQALKNAGKVESGCYQEEIFEILLNFYKNLASSKGGELPFYYIDGFVVKFPDGSLISRECKRHNILTDNFHGEKQIYFPMSNLYKSVMTGKHYMDRTDEDMLQELCEEKQLLEQIYNTL